MERQPYVSHPHQAPETLEGAFTLVKKAIMGQAMASLPDSRQLMESCRRLSKALLERALEAELTHHLGYHKGDSIPAGQPNHRNGASLKTIRTDWGGIDLEIPRDRRGTFRPILVPRHQRRFSGLEGRILAMYAQRDSPTSLKGHLGRFYPADVSPGLLREVTQAVQSEMRAQSRLRLEPVYAVVYFAALKIQLRQEVAADHLTARLALGVLPDGSRQLLGVWDSQGGKGQVGQRALAELAERGARNILIAVVDGVMTLPPAPAAGLLPDRGQSCRIHIIRNLIPQATVRYLPTPAATASLCLGG